MKKELMNLLEKQLKKEWKEVVVKDYDYRDNEGDSDNLSSHYLHFLNGEWQGENTTVDIRFDTSNGNVTIQTQNGRNVDLSAQDIHLINMLVSSIENRQMNEYEEEIEKQDKKIDELNNYRFKTDKLFKQINEIASGKKDE